MQASSLIAVGLSKNLPNPLLLLRAIVANSQIIFTDVLTYGFNGTNSTSSIFYLNNSTTFNLPTPVLNISAFYIWSLNLFPISNALFKSAGGISNIFTAIEALSYPSRARFARIDRTDNRTYDIPYIRDNGRCQQQNAYQWGFSFLLLFIALLLSALWALGMWAMWLDAYCNSKIDAAGGRDMGSWRAVMDLAEAIAACLNSDSTRGQDSAASIFAETKDMGDGEIRRRVERKSKRGEIEYVDLVRSDMAAITRSAQLRMWLQKRRWGRWLLRWRGWIIAATVLVVLLIVVVFPVLSFAR
jgi:hypothetical protein